MKTEIIGCISANQHGVDISLLCSDCGCTEGDVFDSEGCAEMRRQNNCTLIFNLVRDD